MAGINQIFVNGVAYDVEIYAPIEITSISNSAGTVELGSTVNTVTINWQTNNEPVIQTVNGTAVDKAERTAVLEGLSLTQDTTFAVKVTDERGATATKSTAVTFLNGVYCGVLQDGAAIDSAAILTLTKRLQAGKSIKFSSNAAAGKKIAVALPTRYGTPNFNVGGFDGGFSKAATIEFTNASGYTESYDVWLSDNAGLGQTTVIVT